LAQSAQLVTQEPASARVLAALDAELGGCDQVDFEFSLRLRPGAVEASGRFACWLSGDAVAAFAPIARALARLGAPEQVLTAQRHAAWPIRQGIAVAITAEGCEFRLYLHGRDHAQRDDCRAWRWQSGSRIRTARYAFHFLSGPPGEQWLLDRVDAAVRPALACLLADERLRRTSGFWLRRSGEGALEQVYVTFPWFPPAGSLPGVDALADLLAVPRDDTWRTLPVRHVALPVDWSAPAATLYTAAPRDQGWPRDEAALQDLVRCGAQALNRELCALGAPQ
jgi:hypothetical protein